MIIFNILFIIVLLVGAPFSPVFPSSSEVGIQLNSITGTLSSPSVGNTLLSSSLSLGSPPVLPRAHESTALSLRASKTALKHLAPYAFPRVQQELARLLTEHKKRLNDLKSKHEDADLNRAIAESLQADAVAVAHTSRLQARITSLDLSPLDHLIRNQGDCGADSIALFLFSDSHAQFNHEEWLGVRANLARLLIYLCCFCILANRELFFRQVRTDLANFLAINADTEIPGYDGLTYSNLQHGAATWQQFIANLRTDQGRYAFICFSLILLHVQSFWKHRRSLPRRWCSTAPSPSFSALIAQTTLWSTCL